MTSLKQHVQGLVLAVHPTTRGFGWILFESALSPINWGVASAKASRKTRLLARFERILKRSQPETLVLEAFEGSSYKRGARSQELCRAMLHIARSAGLDTPIYQLSTIQSCFESVGAKTRYEIAQVIAQQIDALRPRLPRERKAWMPEGHNQSLFDAAALAITHFANAEEG